MKQELYNQMALVIAERNGIIEYTVKGNIMTFYEVFNRNVNGKWIEIKWKRQYNLFTGETISKCVKGAKFQ